MEALNEQSFQTPASNQREPHTITGDRMGRESTTEQSVGENATGLVGWAYRGTHETSSQWIGF
jgi:hypothetical protein